MLEILAFTSWTGFLAYALWYTTCAKHYAPITPKDARTLLKIHRQTTHCDARRWRDVKHGSKIVGFECECGYKHIQKRPLIGRAPAVQASPEAPILGHLVNMPRPRAVSESEYSH